MPTRLTPLRHSFAPTALMASLCAAALTACVSIPPEPHGVTQPAAAAAELPADIRLAGAHAWPSDHWWTRYGDTQLDALVDRALQASPTLQAATARR